MEEGKKNKFLDDAKKANFIFGFVSGIAVISLLLFIIFLVMFLSGSRLFKTSNDLSGSKNLAATQTQNSPSVTQPDNQQPKLGKPRPIDKTDHVIGDPNAKVEIIEYSDFECPFCGRFFPTVKRILKEYKGKVKFAYRHFPLSFHPEAQKAAEASECAAEQGKFWQMHDKIFQAQNTPDFNVQGWKKFAKQLGLNTAKFNKCLDSGKYADKVKKDLQEGTQLGITGTPTTFINGEAITGAYPYSYVKAVIDKYLAQ